jgi:hypothetical protein
VTTGRRAFEIGALVLLGAMVAGGCYPAHERHARADTGARSSPLDGVSCVPVSALVFPANAWDEASIPRVSVPPGFSAMRRLCPDCARTQPLSQPISRRGDWSQIPSRGSGRGTDGLSD